MQQVKMPANNSSSTNSTKTTTDLKKLQEEYRRKLAQVAQLSPEQAREKLFAELEQELLEEKAQRIKKMEEQFKKEAEERAREILLTVMQRIVRDQVAESTITTVRLPDDELKSRIIGKEGRNIKTFERLTGVNILIDETPQVVTLSSFDPVRREIAHRALEDLVSDGRIQPARIEEAVKKAKKEVEKIINEAGEELVYRAGVLDLPPEIVNLLGRFKFRSSYGQNMIEHTLEVVNIGKALAAELKADVELVKKACLLHDIGKAVSAEIEGPHDQVGALICRQHGIDEIVVRTFEGHHSGDFPNPEAVIVYLADTISAHRPGARREDFNAYINRIKTMENIALSFPGVKEAYAIAAGREVRVIVNPQELREAEMVNLAHQISRQIHEQVKNFPGQIKVTVIRETRVNAYVTAKIQ